MDGEGKREFTYADLPPGASLQQRPAQALNGLEVSDAIATQVARLVEVDLALGPVVAGMFHDRVLEHLRLNGRLNKEHLTYPRVSWVGSILIGDEGTLGFTVGIWPDTVANHAFIISLDVPGPVANRLTFDQERTMKPDEIRRRHGLAIRGRAILPNNQEVTVLLPSDFEFGASGLPTASAQRAKLAQAAGAQPPITPNIALPKPENHDDQVMTQATQIAADDLVATPPDTQLPATPPSSPGSIAKEPPAHLGRIGSPRRK